MKYSNRNESFICVQKFEFAAERHTQLDVPMILLNETYKRVEAKVWSNK